MAKKRRSKGRSKSGGFGNGLVGQAVGVGGYILFEALVEPYIAKLTGQGTLLNVVELAGAAYFARKGGVVGSIAKAAVVINIYQLLQPMLGGIAASSNGSSSLFAY